MDKNIEFTIEFKDKATGVVSQMNLSLKDADEVIRQVRGSIEGLSGDLVNAGQSTQAFSAAMDVLRQVDGTIKGLAQGYNDYAVAEARLTQVMRNTMDASDDEIRSIVDLCSAQEKLGVVEDDVAMAGAQELGTYLGLSSSLQTLIPVLNDMLAQQYGVNATQESAVAIATMLGKVMEGQTSALSRYGYSFDEVQEKILKFGTEEEKAATLAAVVAESVGGMNEALANTDPGRMKQLQMEIDGVKDKIGKITQGALPFLDIASQSGIALMGVMQLGQGLKVMTVHLKGSAVATAAAAVHDKVLTAAKTMLSAATKGATVSTGALTVAVTALYAALTLGISAAITGIVALLSSLGNKAEDSSKQLESLSDAQDAFSQASGDARSHIELEISKLKTLIDTKKDTRKAVADLNSEYGKIFGTYSTAAQWYDVLKSKSAAYCQQLGYEAQARVLAQRKAEAELERSTIQSRMDNMFKPGTSATRQTFKTFNQLGDRAKELDREIAALGSQFDVCTQKMSEAAQTLSDGKGDFNAATASYDELKNEIDLLDTQLKSLAPTEVAEINRIRTKRDEYKKLYDAMGKRLGLDKGSNKDEFSGKSLIANATSYKAIGNNIAYYKTQLDKLNPSRTAEVARISEVIKGLEEQQRQVKLLMDASTLEVATESSSLDVINQNIAFQQELRKTASKENIAAIDAEIRRLTGLKESVEEAGFQIKALGDIKTYEELAQQLQHYEKQLQKTSGTEREAIQKNINDLKELKKGWDEALAAMNKPGDISTLSTIQDLSDAIAYYESVQKRQSGAELQSTQRTIDALSRKKAMLEGVASIPTMQGELSDLNGLQGKELKMELELIGLDNLKGKVRELRKMLADTTNPLDGDARRQVEALANEYENYYNTLKRGQISVSKVWGSIRGVGGAIESLTDTLTGDGSAWKKFCGVMDAGIAIFEGVAAIVEIIKTITKASTVATVANTTATAAQTGVEATNSATVAAAAAVTTPLLHAEAAAWETLAAARIFAAHAEIPFAGVPVAAGFVATMEGIMAAVRIPKFADGAIAYGPTVGLFGEYANAVNNPEVVAPLDRLRSMIGGASGISGSVEFEIKGRKLVGILQKESRLKERG